MTVGYNKNLGVVLVILGLFLLSIASFKLISEKIVFLAGFLVGIASLSIGVSYLTKPYFVWRPGRLVVYPVNLPTKKIYPLSSADNLKVERNAVYRKTSSRIERVEIVKWLADQRDWRRFVEKINTQLGEF